MVPCDGGLSCASQRPKLERGLSLHAPHTYCGRSYDLFSCKLFWQEKGWVPPYEGDTTIEDELDKCGHYCGHKAHLGGEPSYCTLHVGHINPF